MTRLTLREITVSGLLIATLTVGLSGFVTEGLIKYDVEGNVDSGPLNQLKQVGNQTNIADRAQTRASGISAESNYFTLPNVVKTGRLVFDSIPILNTFISVFMNVTGLSMSGNWFLVLASGALTISVAFIFARRWF